MLRTVAVSEEVGIRALVVHAIDDSARAFYTRFGFEPSPTDANNLQIIIKDIKVSLERGHSRRSPQVPLLAVPFPERNRAIVES